MRHATLILLLLCSGCGVDLFSSTGTIGRGCVDYDTVFGCPGSGGNVSTHREGLGVSVVNGVVYAVGGNHISTYGFGYFNYSTLATVDAYDPVTTSWMTKAPLPTPRHGLGVGVVNGVVYAIGGAGSYTTNYKATVEAYDPVTDSWTAKAPMPTPRYGLGLGVVTGVLYAVGGEDSSHVSLATVEAYDPATNSWTSRAPMLTARGSLGIGVVNGVLYAVGGYNPGNVTTIEVSDPQDH